MPAGLPDFTNGIDFTIYATQTAAMHNQLVSNGVPATDRGMTIVTTDTALNTPDVPNPDLDPGGSYLKLKRFLWIRRPHSTASDTTPLSYVWNENAVSHATYRKWVRSVSDTASLQAEIDALDVRVTAVEASAASALATANAANATAATASVNATNALANASSAGTTANTALTTANIANTTATTANTTANTALTTATAAKATADTATANITNIQTQLKVATSGSVALNTIVAAGKPIDELHNLGATPRQVRAVLVCTTADLNYDIGDEVDTAGVDGAALAPFGVAWANSTRIGFSNWISAANVQIPNKTTGALTPVTVGSWSLKVYASVQ